MDGASSEPTVMPLDLLREITNGFSEKRKIGSGSFGKVYLGVYPDGEKIAVKMLYDMPGLDDEQFQNEFKSLTRLRHQNIVRLVGYCHDIQEVQVWHEGKLVLAEKTHRALCLEYMPNGSLEKYLSDECDRYDWQKGYRMITGICQGLKYLQNELKPPIYHLDLKPANVLLDENMVPRIADFGMSRLFGDEQTRATKSSLGTIGYLPPEYIKKNLVSSKFDIFSLGVVIIKIMAGRSGYFKSADMSTQEFTNLVQENWTNRLLETSNRRNAYSEQVKICIEIGLSCVQEDRHKRPTIQDIVDRLKETETKCTYAARKDWSLIFQEANGNTFPQYAQDPNDRRAKRIYQGPIFNQVIAPTAHSNCVEENASPGEVRLGDDSQFYSNLGYLADGVPLPGIARFQIAGDPRPGFTLTACCFPTNGITHGNFQWVRWLEDGTRQPIEGATMHDYVVTADDVGTLLAVDCTPVDDNGRQGNLVTEFANSKSKITCALLHDFADPPPVEESNSNPASPRAAAWGRGSRWRGGARTGARAGEEEQRPGGGARPQAEELERAACPGGGAGACCVPRRRSWSVPRRRSATRWQICWAGVLEELRGALLELRDAAGRSPSSLGGRPELRDAAGRSPSSLGVVQSVYNLKLKGCDCKIRI